MFTGFLNSVVFYQGRSGASSRDSNVLCEKPKLWLNEIRLKVKPWRESYIVVIIRIFYLTWKYILPVDKDIVFYFLPDFYFVNDATKNRKKFNIPQLNIDNCYIYFKMLIFLNVRMLSCIIKYPLYLLWIRVLRTYIYLRFVNVLVIIKVPLWQ